MELIGNNTAIDWSKSGNGSEGPNKASMLCNGESLGT